MAGMVVKRKPLAGGKPSAAGSNKGRVVKKKIAGMVEQTPIKFTATIGQVKITSRGAMVGFLIPDSQLEKVSLLIQTKIPNTILEMVAIVKVKNAEKEKNPRRNKQRRRWNK